MGIIQFFLKILSIFIQLKTVPEAVKLADLWKRLYFRYNFFRMKALLSTSNWESILTDTGENVQKWTRVFSTRRWVILVARTRRKKDKKIACPLLDIFSCGQVPSPRLYRLRSQFYLKVGMKNKNYLVFIETTRQRGS